MSLEQPTAVLSAVECVGDKRPPSGLVNAFAHGFELLLRLFQKSPPSSITRFVATCSLGLHLATGVRQVWLQGHEYFRIFFMSSISIEAGSSTSEHVRFWLRKHVSPQCRTLMVSSGYSSWGREHADELADGPANVGPNQLDQKGMPNFLPELGSSWFRHCRKLFKLDIQRRTLTPNSPPGCEIIYLSCIGCSTQPVEDLITECQRYHSKTKVGRTVVREPAPKNILHGLHPWKLAVARPSRFMSSVFLDNDTETELLNDMKDYLRPSSQRWYAIRGIPYRRGYLFHGPPGTGKTSAALALGGGNSAWRSTAPRSEQPVNSR